MQNKFPSTLLILHVACEISEFGEKIYHILATYIFFLMYLGVVQNLSIIFDEVLFS